MDDRLLAMVENDIQRIDHAISHGSNESRWELFCEINGRYQTCIADYYEGMYKNLPGKNALQLAALKDSPDKVAYNLRNAKAKLETFRFGANAIQHNQVPTTQVTVTNNLHVDITFEQARARIEDMTFLTEEETKAVLEKLSEIEETVKSGESKKTKWEKVKPVLKWIADKSFDVGTALLPMILKIQ